MTFRFGLIAGWILTGAAAIAAAGSAIVSGNTGSVEPAAVAPIPPVEAAARDEVILPRLRGLVFVGSLEAVVQNGVSSDGIVLDEAVLVDPSGFRTLVTPYLGQPVTRRVLDRMIKQVIDHYRRHDRPVVDVLVPEQDITAGTVQVVVLEGRVGKISVAGNRWFSDQQIQGGLRLQPGDPIRSARLQEDLDWLNANPFRTTDVIFSPGTEPGRTDVTLRSQDRFPLRLYAGYNNDGNSLTGQNQYEVGFNWGGVLGSGQQLNFQHTTSGGNLRAQSASYIVPLPWRDTLTFFGSYTRSRGAIPPYLGISGRSYQISGRYLKPLPVLGAGAMKYRHGLTVGFDYKSNDNALEFAGIAAGGTLYNVAQVVLAYNGSVADRSGRTMISLEGYHSPGGWGAHNTDAAFHNAHTLADVHYTYALLSLERVQRLPADWSAVLRGTVQRSDSNLVPSEQMGFGGFNTVRGYEQRAVNADQGAFAALELRTPNFSLGRRFDRSEWGDAWQLLAFWDGAIARNHTPLPNEPRSERLASVGLGLRGSVGTHATLRFDWGFRLRSTGAWSGNGSRGSISVVVSY